MSLHPHQHRYTNTSGEEYDDDRREEYVASNRRRYYFDTDVETGRTTLYRSNTTDPAGLEDPANWSKYRTFSGDDLPTMEELGIY